MTIGYKLFRKDCGPFNFWATSQRLEGEMTKRFCVLLVALVATMGFASSAYAVCAENYNGNLSPNSYLHTAYSYTNYSVWDGTDGKGYTAERHDSGGMIQYFANVSGGGSHYFDNVTSAPWRRTSFFNWNQYTAAGVFQENHLGSCT